MRYLMSLGKELAAPRQPALGGAAGAAAQKFDLRNISILADRLGDPHRASPCVHIAGTNGKGSTAAMLDSILRAVGLRTGLYTSPHLARINERIRVAGEDISDANFAATFSRVHAFIEVLLASGSLAAHPTYFECLTAMAFDFFASGCHPERTGGGCHPERSEGSVFPASHCAGVDFAIYEVGMGGRLDATNLVVPEVAIITQIDFDHESFLGHSIEEIAAEKAGIIKPGAWVVSSAERPEARGVIARRCAEQHARLVEVDTACAVENLRAENGCYRADVSHAHSKHRIALALPLPGRYQVRNALAALAAARLLAERGFPIDDAAIARGIALTYWPGRLELLQQNPAVFLDGTHNPAGARALLAFWEENFSGRCIHLVYGAMRDKAVDEIAGLLFPFVSSVTLTEPGQPRAITAAELARIASHHLPPTGRLEVIPAPAEALEHAISLAAPADAVFATGSLYLAGDLRRYWLSRSVETQPAIRSVS
ncbi:MAG: bifunctional folylpolyglutamate synthase/dihydrofolate synthase [Acidobacteria bacterium]|nr:bifunctional folylpolyglutamate synthase/dihydrofolate synthase [Acidobacteriota bacterium]